MNEFLILGFCFIAGSGLGAFFFIGLWWTVRTGLTAKYPAVLFLASLLVRTSTVITGFYFLSHSEWQRMVSLLIGFLFSRELIKRISQRQVLHAA